MTSTKILCCLLVIVSMLVDKIVGTNSIKFQLSKTLNERQNVTTIKGNNGDIYNCIDFYDQPAFKHHLLKNHKYFPEMRPKFLPNITTIKNDTFTSEIYVLENGGCPVGSVPIKKLSKDDHSLSSMFSKTHYTKNVSSNGQIAPPGTHFAIYQTKASPNPPHYYGVGAEISVWNPQVKENQYSGAQITIRNGPESLQVGWMVNPTMYKDTKTHMFIHTNAGESKCYNTYCPGFVIVRADFPPDVELRGYSVRGKSYRLMPFFIYRETISGDWWLLVTCKLVPIGFWPARIFSSLNNFGTYISCGGETYSPPDQPEGLPPMGAGAYPTKISLEDAFAQNFVSANEKLQAIVAYDDVEKFRDTEKYVVRDFPPQKDFGHVIYFGGYGG